MLKSAAAAAALVAATLAVSAVFAAPAAAADGGVRLSIGWDAGPSHRWDGRVEDRRWRGDDKRPGWRHHRHRASCRTVLQVERIYGRHGRVIRVVETPVEICRPRWR